ncbi:hypothetical protein G6F22_012107 [Rhizopus arrhizus]|nr:hypothetical protein G6F22_012107 [Rhizopus arrhizus]
MRSVTRSRNSCSTWTSSIRCSLAAGCGRSIGATWPNSAAATTSVIPRGHWPMQSATTPRPPSASGLPARCAFLPTCALPGMCSIRSASITATSPMEAPWTASWPRSPTPRGRNGMPMCCRSPRPPMKVPRCAGSSTRASTSRPSCRWTAAMTGASTCPARTCACTCRSRATVSASSMPPRPCSAAHWMAPAWPGCLPAIR